MPSLNGLPAASVCIKRFCWEFFQKALKLARNRSLYIYKHKRGEQAAVSLRIKEVCEGRVSYGQLAAGKRQCNLTIVDTLSRYSPATDKRFNYSGEDVVQNIERVHRQLGYPQTIRVDNGSEFITKYLDLWVYLNAVLLDFSRPGKPPDNAYIETSNGKFSAECLNQYWFRTLEDTCQKMENWLVGYNEVRPHCAIRNK